MSTGVPPPKAFPPPLAMGQSGSGAVLNDSGVAQPGAQLQPYTPSAPAPATTTPTPAPTNTTSTHPSFDPSNYDGDVYSMKMAYRNRNHNRFLTDEA